MANNSKIEWTDASWNPITGCTKISDGCKNCYAERLACRLQLMGQKKYTNGFDITVHEDTFNEPLKWKKPTKVFVCSMSDLFHENVGFDTIDKIFNTMYQAKNHIFQVVTKRSERLLEYAKTIKWPSNVWAGVTVESYKYINRIDDLRSVDAPIRFLSIEPLLSSIPKLNLSGIHWVIVGGESGYGSRQLLSAWVEDIRDQCLGQDIPFFFKQWGGANKKKSGRSLNNVIWDETPPIAMNL